MRAGVAAFLALAALFAGCSSDGPPSRPLQPATPAGAEEALRVRLVEDRALSVQFVHCFTTDVRSSRGEKVFRCSVSFGEPKIYGYCVVVRDGAAVTHVEEPALHCRRTRTGDEP
ncbi:MAG: hypothetical protein H6531_06715 [Actinobacteria bacterium]|nr:hypothetical protein [Actinomycetota bacterium]